MTTDEEMTDTDSHAATFVDFSTDGTADGGLGGDDDADDVSLSEDDM